MKIWAVNTPDIFSGMIHTSLFVSEEDAKAKYDASKDRGATMGQVDDIWGFCARHFEDVIMDVIDSFHTENSHWNHEKKNRRWRVD